MRNIERIAIEKSTGKTFLVKDLDQEFHTGEDIIAKKLLQKEGLISSSKGKEYLVLKPQFSDLWNSLQRGPQIMIQKDIGLILAKTGINRDSVVVDAGGGSGSLCLSLANICGKITVYETNPEHYALLTKNVSLFGLKNMLLKQENVYEGISEQELDLITLDLPEPWLALNSAEQALRCGGHIVVYLPNLHQVKKYIDAAKKTAIKVLEIIELLERKWNIDDKIMRPEFAMLGHTGFMVFCRKF
ncbi:MAG TPA: hypothetical protein VJH68_03515 [Candidatus Nanoarchaeia archaeon]|nr:hypothetical protein [Candidatus Nanoarchaeia archaeon]